MLIDLLRQDGLDPRHKGHGEHCSPCPSCGGHDRFIAHADTGKYWCRQCGAKGDCIEYLRRFHGMTFRQAAELAGKVVPLHTGRAMAAKRQDAARAKSEPPPKAWAEQAKKLIQEANRSLLGDEPRLEWLRTERGLTRATAERFRMGWLGFDRFADRATWGLPEVLREDGKAKNLLLPAGLIVPGPNRIRIRRATPGEYGKYFVLPGSGNSPLIIGTDPAAPALIVESELDALLLAQEFADHALVIIATGSTSNGPSAELEGTLEWRPATLVSLDSDEAGGKAAWSRWMQLPNATRCPIPSTLGKDPSEVFLAGLDLRQWLAACYRLAGLDDLRQGAAAQ